LPLGSLIASIESSSIYAGYVELAKSASVSLKRVNLSENQIGVYAIRIKTMRYNKLGGTALLVSEFVSRRDVWRPWLLDV
jgi:hypothetical protein